MMEKRNPEDYANVNLLSRKRSSHRKRVDGLIVSLAYRALKKVCCLLCNLYLYFSPLSLLIVSEQDQRTSRVSRVKCLFGLAWRLFIAKSGLSHNQRAILSLHHQDCLWSPSYLESWLTLNTPAF